MSALTVARYDSKSASMSPNASSDHWLRVFQPASRSPASSERDPGLDPLGRLGPRHFGPLSGLGERSFEASLELPYAPMCKKCFCASDDERGKAEDDRCDHVDTPVPAASRSARAATLSRRT